jgi:2-isopropylmalate synthase
VAYILEKNYGYHLPKAMHPEIGRIVQAISDKNGKELSAKEILDIFKNTYFKIVEHISLVEFTHSTKAKISTCQLTYECYGKRVVALGQGNGPIDACKKALMKDYENGFILASYSEHSCGDKSSAKAVAYIEIQNKDTLSCFGVGAHSDIATASIKALFCALNRAFA